MNNLNIPNIGSRNIKTGIAVLICLLLFPGALNPPIAAIICMQSTIENSVQTGINRLIGTFLGGILGIVMLLAISKLNLHSFSTVISAVNVCLIIYICNVIKKPAACVIASIVVLSILVDSAVANPIMYSIRRTGETAIGVIIGILINRYINPPEEKLEKMDEPNENK